MEEVRKSGIKSFLEGIARPFKALMENDKENDKDIEADLEEVKRVQASLKRETDYSSNIEEKEFIPKVETKEIRTKIKQTQKSDSKDLER